MTGRRSCPACGAVYHIKNLRPKVDNICDNDGANLVQRPDDKPEVVANRLKAYHQQKEPVVDYYRHNNTIADVDAGLDADQTSALVFEKLDTLVRA
jgi:adenylate kinase